MKRKPINPPALPEKLNTPAFIILWAEFRQHRLETKHPLTPTSEARLLKKLSTFDVRDVCAMVEQSIELGWRGVFPVHRQPVAYSSNDFGRARVEPQGQVLHTPATEPAYYCADCRQNHKWNELCPLVVSESAKMEGKQPDDLVRQLQDKLSLEPSRRGATCHN